MASPVFALDFTVGPGEWVIAMPCCLGWRFVTHKGRLLYGLAVWQAGMLLFAKAASYDMQHFQPNIYIASTAVNPNV
jgi:hypothetical protein